MSLARWVEQLFMGRDLRKEKDKAIAEQKAINRNYAQSVQSGARMIEHMSGVMQIVAESKHAE